MVELFEAQAARAPDATAVVFGDLTLSYGELNERSNQLARILIARGVGPERVIALAVPRSLDMVVGLFGILKSGAAYLPLDHDYPIERLQFMVADAAPDCLVSTSMAANFVSDTLDCIWLDALETKAALQGEAGTDLTDEDRASPLRTCNPAYVIYTSGSTGRPKGVVTSHRSIVNRLDWMQSIYRLDEGDSVVQKTPISFDVSVWELLLPLVVGARLVVSQPGSHRDQTYLVDLIKREKVTIAHFVPSMLGLILDNWSSGDFGSLREIICSGETLPVDIRNSLVFHTGIKLSNLYGPTEAAIDVTYWLDSGEEQGTVPIGRPIWNTEVYVLDAFLRPVPAGVAGELYIAGEGLA
ncbi:AMP-binding protein, partial [Sphingomonas sp. LB2R24]|uniref:AMP-binding protein n=1 Tax=Sphingomonas sorbitolis TaxID=3096165 RepID=UPI002FCA4044